MKSAVVTLPSLFSAYQRSQQRGERQLADLLAQRLQRERAARVDRAVEHRLRAARVARRRVPEPGVRGRRRVGDVELLLRGAAARLRLRPAPLRPAGEALVQPDVVPRRQRHRVAEPLVCDLVHHGREPGGVGVVGLRLGLERVADVRRGVDGAAGGVERVRADEVGEEGDDLRLAGEVRARAGRVDRVVDRDAVRRLALREGRRCRWWRSSGRTPSGCPRASATSSSRPRWPARPARRWRSPCGPRGP